MRLSKKVKELMKKSLIALLIAVGIAGCASTEPNYKDGKEYAGNYPVLYRGVIEDIRYYDKEGLKHSLADIAHDSYDTGAVDVSGVDQLASGAAQISTGIGSVGGGVIGGVLQVAASVALGAATNSTRPGLPEMLIRKDNGHLEIIQMPAQHLREIVKFNCLDIGEPVRVLTASGPKPIVEHADPRLDRFTAFDPSCESLRKKHNLPLRFASSKKQKP